MRILYHHRTQAEDAQGIHIAEMIRAFRGLGHTVDLVALVDSNPEEAPEKKATRPNHSFRKKWLAQVPVWFYELMQIAYNLVGYFRIARAIKAKRPDLIYERYSLNTLCGILASRRFKIPILLEVNAPLFQEQNALGQLKFKGLARRTERWICSNSTKTIVVSTVMKEILMREGVPAEKLIVMTNGIDPAKFSPAIDGTSIREKYDLNGQTVIGFVGWFRQWHGLEMLLEVFHQADLGKWARLMLIGDGPAYPDLVQYVKTHQLESQVIFTGPVARAEVARCIAAMDIAIQPSAPEYACPMKIIEYMAMGKCIVAPAQPNIQEILSHGQTGQLFQPGNKASFQAALQALLTDSRARSAMGANAYQAVLDRGYLWCENAKRAVNLISQNI